MIYYNSTYLQLSLTRERNCNRWWYTSTWIRPFLYESTGNLTCIETQMATEISNAKCYDMIGWILVADWSDVSEASQKRLLAHNASLTPHNAMQIVTCRWIPSIVVSSIILRRFDCNRRISDDNCLEAEVEASIFQKKPAKTTINILKSYNNTLWAVFYKQVS